MSAGTPQVVAIPNLLRLRPSLLLLTECHVNALM